MGYSLQHNSTSREAGHKMWVMNIYGYRYYDPNTGRWPLRDPIEEQGGVNLYGFVGNDGVSAIDVFGWQSWSYPGTGVTVNNNPTTPSPRDLGYIGGACHYFFGGGLGTFQHHGN